MQQITPVCIASIQLGHVNARHHVVVFVFKIVAVKQISTAETVPAHDDIDLLTLIDADSVFPSALVLKWRTTVPAQYLKRSEVCVYGVEHGKAHEAAIDETPHLNVVQLGRCIDSVWIKWSIVDEPLQFWRQAQIGSSSKGERSCPNDVRGMQRLEL